MTGAATSHSEFGAVAGDFVMDDVECEGDEADLTDCQHSVAHNCGVTEGAGVRCSARKLLNMNIRLWITLKCQLV